MVILLAMVTSMGMAALSVTAALMGMAALLAMADWGNPSVSCQQNRLSIRETQGRPEGGGDGGGGVAGLTCASHLVKAAKGCGLCAGCACSFVPAPSPAAHTQLEAGR